MAPASVTRRGHQRGQGDTEPASQIPPEKAPLLKHGRAESRCTIVKTW